MPLPGIILSIVLAVLFLAVGIPKIVAQPKAMSMGEHLGFAPKNYRYLGLLDIVGAAGLLIGLAWAPIGIAAAIGFVFMMIGAAYFHVRAKDSVNMVMPASAIGAAAAAVVVFQIVGR